MSEYVQAWQCIGCGKIEAPQNCVGVCQDRKIELVHAFHYRQVVSQLQLAARTTRTREYALEKLARWLAWTTPHNDEWEHSYRALQQEARKILADTGPDLAEIRARAAATDQQLQPTTAQCYRGSGVT